MLGEYLLEVLRDTFGTVGIQTRRYYRGELLTLRKDGARIHVEKTVEPVVDRIVHFYDDENGNLVRSRQVQIGKTIYTIISREIPNAKTSAFDITKRLIESQAESLMDDLSITTESLEGCNSGGKKQ